jgi:hypothetical protein
MKKIKSQRSLEHQSLWPVAATFCLKWNMPELHRHNRWTIRPFHSRKYSTVTPADQAGSSHAIHICYTCAPLKKVIMFGCNRRFAAVLGYARAPVFRNGPGLTYLPDRSLIFGIESFEHIVPRYQLFKRPGHSLGSLLELLLVKAHASDNHASSHTLQKSGLCS